MSDKLPEPGWRDTFKRAIPFRSPAAGEEEALAPEFALTHNAEPIAGVSGSHVNWEQVTMAEKEADLTASMSLDIDCMLKDEQ
ncbi:hypothetical protein OIN60_19565 [Paenibacillus sp. P96]|uniref:Uncharacterized protein n=1 Tax=Paenibacillus zeirhizosphaerae TaxID=2987519 RepID=A0ABT9FW17_9BACL|nr:hypothetical protein [Paenibacillus sp. P96]MDP4098926.1 hypothetical protein [Paenibacillus sp. P96]